MRRGRSVGQRFDRVRGRDFLERLSVSGLAAIVSTPSMSYNRHRLFSERPATLTALLPTPSFNK